MTDKKLKEHQIGIGEINTIREILMGERFDTFERELKSLRKEVNKLRNDAESGLHEMRNIIKHNSKSMKVEMLNKIVDLENRMVKNQEKINQRMKKNKQDQSEKLSKLFIKIGKELAS